MAVTFTVHAFVSHWTTTFVSCSAHRLNAGSSIRAGVLQTLALRYWMKEKKGRLWALKRDINRLWTNSFMFHQIITVPNWILWKVRLKVGLVEKVMWKDYPLQGKTHFLVAYVYILQVTFHFINDNQLRHSVMLICFAMEMDVSEIVMV